MEFQYGLDHIGIPYLPRPYPDMASHIYIWLNSSMDYDIYITEIYIKKNNTNHQYLRIIKLKQTIFLIVFLKRLRSLLSYFYNLRHKTVSIVYCKLLAEKSNSILSLIVFCSDISLPLF